MLGMHSLLARSCRIIHLHTTLAAGTCCSWPSTSTTAAAISSNAGSGPKRGNEGTAAEKAAEYVEESAAETVRQLHPAFTSFLNSGYMESQRQLRDRLIKTEWDDTAKSWALRKGVADFEKYVAEHGEEAHIHVSWEVMQALYESPEDLTPLAGNERARLMAQALITQAVVAQQVEVYKACSETAKQLANVIESSQRTGASTLLGAIRKLLPLPFLK